MGQRTVTGNKRGLKRRRGTWVGAHTAPSVPRDLRFITRGLEGNEKVSISFLRRSSGREGEERSRDETAHIGSFRSPAKKGDHLGREQGPHHTRPAPT